MKRLTPRRALLLSAGAGGALGGMSGVVALGLAAYFARQLVTPERQRPDDATVVTVRHALDGRASSAVFAPSVESLAPGRYGLFWDDERGHARIGEIIGRTNDGGVIRRVDRVTRGDLRPGPARWSGYYVDGSPEAAYGLPTEDVVLDTEHGPAPAWLTRAGQGAHWAVLVHGRGARRTETLRAVPVLHELGVTALVPSYRNDSEGPASPDGRYGLGLTEWRDVEVAVQYALSRGATTIDLLGWSMGGAIVMQFLVNSCLAPGIRKVVLDGPVLDWADVMSHHARANHLHPRLAALAATLLRGRSRRHTVGLVDTIDVRLTDWVARQAEIGKPTLIIHSVDDEFVPYGPSAKLAAARPDLVTWQRWETARHVREWNTDPERWERVVADFVAAP